MVRTTRRAALSAPLLLSASAGARAQQPAPAWPARPVVLVVPWAPGGSNDLTARLLAPHLSERFGQAFVVDNRPGGGGAVGMGQAARAKPDGHTLLVSSASNHVFNHLVVPDQGYDPREALSAAAMLTDVPNALAANAALGVSDVPGLVAELKASPGMVFASSGVGSSNHLAGELFRMLTGTRMVHVPYRGGGPAVSDLVAGTVSVAFLNLPTLLPALDSGRVRLLGVCSGERVPTRPDLPTVAEQGVPNYAVRSWTGLFAPRGTPPGALARVSEACRDALALPAVKSRLDELASVPIWAGPAETDAFVRAEFDKWGPVVRAAGVKPE